MDYEKTLLKEEIVIKKIISIHYFEYAKDYVYEGEKHDFWEFLYVDKGEVEVMADTLGLKLRQGEIIFHKPNEFHNVWANGKVAPNLIVVSFECKSPAMKYYENKILRINDFERNLLVQIINEAKEAYTTHLGVTYAKLDKKQNPLFGCEQLIKIYLEQLLINMIRKGNSVNRRNRLSTAVKERSDNDLLQRIINFLNENITKSLSFDDVCRFSNLSRTSLKVLFKDKMGTGVMEYFRKLKIEEAKKLMREGKYNFTQISDILGYTSIHYFSRQFKNVTDMTPSQYVLSVKSKASRL